MSVLIDAIKAVLRDRDDGVRLMSYSGRSMFGQTCVALAGDEDAIRSTITDVVRKMVGELVDMAKESNKIDGVPEEDVDSTKDTFDSMMDLLLHWKVDQLGHGKVYYWPTWHASVDETEATVRRY